MNYALSKIMKQIRGVSYNKSDASLKHEDGLVPVLRAGNIQNSRIIHDDFVYVPREVVKNVQLLKQGDILIAASSGSISVVGKAAMVLQDMNAGFGAFCKVLRPNKEIVNENYFKFYFETPHYKNTISQLAEGANINNLKTEHFDNLEIPLPPLPQQQKIANILDAADELRQNDKALVAKYDELTQALFLDMFGNPVSNPKRWNLKEFLHFTRFDTKMTKDFEKYSEFPHVGIANIEKDSGKIINCSLVKDEDLSSGKYIFTDKHIIYSKIRPNLNKVALPDFTGLCSADSYPLLVNEQNANKIFFAQLLRSESFIEFILKHSTRTNIPKANKDQMKQYKGICPPIELQNQFAERVGLIEEQKAIAQKSLEKSEELFNSLLQKAFKGELI